MTYSDRLRRERAAYRDQPDVPASDARINEIRNRGVRNVEAQFRNLRGAEAFDIEPDRRDAEMDSNPVTPQHRASPSAMAKLRGMVKDDASPTIEARLKRIEDMLEVLVRKHG